MVAIAATGQLSAFASTLLFVASTLHHVRPAHSFSSSSPHILSRLSPPSMPRKYRDTIVDRRAVFVVVVPPSPPAPPPVRATAIRLLRGGEDIDDEDNNHEIATSTLLTDADAILLGSIGIIASFTMLYSEWALLRTGCGLPAGPYGLLGAVEGVSYLGTVGLVGYSLLAKIRTGNGLPSGPGGMLGAAEGLSYLAVLAGIVVLFAQMTNYGYIPNAIPMEGGMCS